jgi:hypothetical protein
MGIRGVVIGLCEARDFDRFQLADSQVERGNEGKVGGFVSGWQSVAASMK